MFYKYYMSRNERKSEFYFLVLLQEKWYLKFIKKRFRGMSCCNCYATELIANRTGSLFLCLGIIKRRNRINKLANLFYILTRTVGGGTLNNQVASKQLQFFHVTNFFRNPVEQARETFFNFKLEKARNFDESIWGLSAWIFHHQDLCSLSNQTLSFQHLFFRISFHIKCLKFHWLGAWAI